MSPAYVSEPELSQVWLHEPTVSQWLCRGSADALLMDLTATAPLRI